MSGIDANPIASSPPLVSVIIACKNSALYFERCLQSVRRQTYPNLEIVVVDNFSTDGTYEIAQKYADKVFQLGPERCTQFNHGFRQSAGELIYRIGPDYLLEPDVIQKCVEKIHAGYDAVAVHNRSVGESLWAQVRYVERESYRNDRSIVAVRFMKRSVFEAVGMFDESLIAGEDFDLHNRLVVAGYQWAHADAVENHLGEPKSILEVWHKFYYYGRTYGRYRAKHRGVAKKQFVFFRPTYRKIQRQLMASPKLFAAFYFYLAVKYLAGLAGMLRGAPRNFPVGPESR